MDFPLATFSAFSEALVEFYSAPTREAAREALTTSLRALFANCDVEIVPRARRARSTAGPQAPGLVACSTLSVPIAGSRWQLVLRRDAKFSRRDEFLVRLFSAHLSNAFRVASPEGRKADEPIPNASAMKVPGLTPRENEVLRWIVVGKRDAQIATLIGASVRTVNKHVENILRKLGAETRSGAALIAEERFGRNFVPRA
jgi:DNA-binding CsgD family transcriptional regulator